MRKIYLIMTLILGSSINLLADTTSGVVFGTQPFIYAEDEHGNRDSDYIGSVTISDNGAGTLGGTVTESASNGRINYNDLNYTATADKETYTLTASDGSISETSTTITSEVIATKLLFTTQPSPTSLQNGVAMDFTTDPVVTAVDADSLVDVDFTESVTITENGAGIGTFTNATAMASSGVATFTGLTLNHDTAETFKLLANGGSLIEGSSEDVTVESNQAPTITGATANQAVNDNATLTPFSGITLADVEDNNISVTITLDDNAKGFLSATTIAIGTISSVQTELQGVVFTPAQNRVAIGNTETTTFTITVNDGTSNSIPNNTTTVISTSINDAPTINTIFHDLIIEENNGTSSYDINISDIDSGDLNLSIESNDTSILTVTPNWSGLLDSNDWINDFNLTTVADANGVVRITITLNDGLLNEVKTFDVNVTAVDYAPILEAITNVNKSEDDNSFNINLSATDSDGDDITYTAISSNTLIATVLITNDNNLTVTPITNANGIVTIDVNATANGKSVMQSFDVNITAINDAPMINTIFHDLIIEENNGTSSYDINISDIDSGDLNLTIESNDTSILTVTPNWSGLLDSNDWINDFNLTTVADANGVVRITITLNDGLLNEVKTFDVNVTAVDYAPILEAITNVNKSEDDNSFNINLSATDSDGDDITYTAISSNTLIATVLITNDNNLTVTPITNANGIVTIDVNATANGKSVMQSFDVNITAINDAPMINTIFHDLIIEENNGTSSYDINISDIDSGDLNLTIESNDTSILTVTPNWSGLLDSNDWINDFNLTTVADANGVVRITITLNDGLLNEVKTFDVNVTAKDKTPNEFSFSPLTNKNLSTQFESNEVQISGIDDGIDISIIGGEYSINGGAWTDLNGTIDSDDNVTVRLTSSNYYSATLTSTIKIGDTTENFVVRTEDTPYVAPPSNEEPEEESTAESNNIVVLVEEDGKKDRTTARFDNNLNVNIDKEDDVTTATMEIEDKKVTVAVNDSGTMEGKIESEDEDGNPVTSSVKVALPKSKTTVDKKGNVYTTVKTDNDSTIKVELGVDGSVNYIVESKNGVSVATSTIPGSKVEIDKNGNVETTAQIEKNGFIYKAVVTTDAIGKTRTKFVIVNVATGEEQDIEHTLDPTTPYEVGIKADIIQLDDLIYIKTTVPLSNVLIIE